MGNDICMIVTVLYNDRLIKCALKVKRDNLPSDDCAQYPMEPTNRATIHSLLPLHVRSCGPIVAIESIFEVHVVEEVEDET